MKSVILNITIILCLLFEGCVTTQNVVSPTVIPEINVNTVDRGKIKSAIINFYMSIGYSIVAESDNSILFSSKEEKFGNALYQSLTNSYNSTSRANIRITTTTINNTTRVIAQAAFIIKNDNGREDIQDLTNDWSTLLLKHLNKIKTDVETL